jgi:hypothetical protein
MTMEQPQPEPAAVDILDQVEAKMRKLTREIEAILRPRTPAEIVAAARRARGFPSNG